ncbi:MAG: 30S ribosomal protein S5 [Candidatus Magasanikbacteria bacterium]|nr:30S ribosomal protein S5 [Candidatus Magasanikbacteria bacterium]
MMNKSFKKKDGRSRDEKKEFDQYIVDLARVTRVTEGGKHMSFRVCLILGDRKGRVGFGLAKGKDVQLGVEKAVRQAKKHIITVPIVNETIPHAIISKANAAVVMLKPAPRGSGIIAGGAVRAVLDLAGVPNISSKIVGRTKNKVAIVQATFAALESFKTKNGRYEVFEKRKEQEQNKKNVNYNNMVAVPMEMPKKVVQIVQKPVKKEVVKKEIVKK